jgi:hypothetical protein
MVTDFQGLYQYTRIPQCGVWELVGPRSNAAPPAIVMLAVFA